MAEEVMIQDNVPTCPKCGGLLRRIQDEDIWYVCVDSYCKTIIKVTDYGQSQRELKCKILK